MIAIGLIKGCSSYALVPLGIFASAMVKCIIIHAMLPDALRF